MVGAEKGFADATTAQPIRPLSEETSRPIVAPFYYRPFFFGSRGGLTITS